MKKRNENSTGNVRFLTITALFVALTYVFTACFHVRLPLPGSGGLIHLGAVPLFIGAMLFGRKTGMFAGAIGLGLFDLLSGWAPWAPFTAVIGGLMGYITGRMTEGETHQTYRWYCLAVGISCVINIFGYYAAEGILYGNWIAPVMSVPGDLIQVGTGAVISLAVISRLNVVVKKMGLKG